MPKSRKSPIRDWPLDLEALFDSALAPSVPLPGGGAIHIDEARAAVLIDVDTGSPETGSAERSARRANLAAARMIARQLRLRQLGGGIVVDFAALDAPRERERVRQAIAAALAGDPARPQLLGWTRLGHLEIVRPRRFRSLSEAMLEAPGRRKNAATLAFEALRRLAAEARANPAANWRLAAVPAVEAALRGPAAAALAALETRLGRRIAVVPLAGGEPAPPIATRSLLTSWPCEPISAAWPIPADPAPVTPMPAGARRCPICGKRSVPRLSAILLRPLRRYRSRPLAQGRLSRRNRGAG